MKPFLIIAGIVLVLAVLGFVLLMPISSNFMRYLWWRMSSNAISLRGSIKAEDAVIHYVIYGTGPPLLLLHGGLSHRLSWFSQVPWLVDSGRQVILMDSRGHGKSDLGNTELSYRLFAYDALQVLDQLGIQRTDVLGWSDGANTALLLTRHWPERVRRIITISSNSNPSGLTPEACADNNQQSSGLTYWFYRFWTGAGQRLGELENRLKRLWSNRPSLKASDLGAIAAPTLVIIGEHDMVTVEHAKEMAATLPHGSIAVIPGGGHATLITHAQQVNMLIGDFLEIPTPLKK